MALSITIDPPASAFFLLRPANAAAELAFTDVVEHVQHIPQDEDPERAARCREMTSHLFLSSQTQSISIPAGRLHRRRIQATMPGSSSPIIDGHNDSSDFDTGGVHVWAGGYFIDLSLEQHSRHRKWSVGRYSERITPNIVLTMDKFTGVARQQTSIRVDGLTRLAYLVASLPDMITVNSAKPVHTPGVMEACRLALPSGLNTIILGQLQYEFEYTNFSRTPQAQGILAAYLEQGGGVRATPEALSATPTPGSMTKTIGPYTLAGIFGAGSFGSVRSAVGPRGDKILAIKTIVSRRKSSTATQVMQNLSQLIGTSTEPCHVLRMVDSFQLPGTLDETHLVLEPFTPITMDKLPVDTHHSKLEITLRDCLRGLQFLHSHGLIHGDIKPNNIGLINVYLEEACVESTVDPRGCVKAFLLDVDGIQSLAVGRTKTACPGSGGTLGYLSPERERSRYDHGIDVWALGVAASRVLLGRVPFPDNQGNPWREDAISKDARRQTFQCQHESVLNDIANSSVTSGAIKKFIWSALCFDGAQYENQTERKSSKELLKVLIEDSGFLQEFEVQKAGNQTDAGRKRAAGFIS